MKGFLVNHPFFIVVQVSLTKSLNIVSFSYIYYSFFYPSLDLFQKVNIGNLQDSRNLRNLPGLGIFGRLKTSFFNFSYEDSFNDFYIHHNAVENNFRVTVCALKTPGKICKSPGKLLENSWNLLSKIEWPP